jgi:3-oxoacyl-[acyl-carrier protein] reductase
MMLMSRHKDKLAEWSAHVLDTGLAGTVALVTGANHGIGAATARALASQGSLVFLHYLRLPEDGSAEGHDQSHYMRNRALSADTIAEDIRAQGETAATGESDLVNPNNIPTLFEQVEAALGPVQVLVNNAAVGGAPEDTFAPLDSGSRDWLGRELEPVTAESHDRHFAVNSRATALMMTEFARRHVARGADWGRIINISTDGAASFPQEVSYGASKYALESYSRSAAMELGRYGITVNIVSPGPIQTGWLRPEDETDIARSIPLGRIGLPEDVADVVVLLASHQARWLTGQLLFVGGGHRML